MANVRVITSRVLTEAEAEARRKRISAIIRKIELELFERGELPKEVKEKDGEDK